MTTLNILTMPVYLKACPRCQGALAMEKDRWGAYLLCIHCGYLKDVDSDRSTK